jgi:hypothetical protein
MTKGRIYVTLGSNGNPKFISYYDKHNKRFKQIDIDGPAHTINGKKELPHTHRGYEHDEKGTRVPSSKEKKLIERVKRIWAYHTGLN